MILVSGIHGDTSLYGNLTSLSHIFCILWGEREREIAGVVNTFAPLFTCQEHARIREAIVSWIILPVKLVCLV